MAKYHFPTWKGWLLINPVRLLLQDPETILGPYARPGMRVLDFGCSMGYFSLPLARLVGPAGRVVCLDSDERQLAVLRRRAAKAHLADRLEIRAVGAAGDDLGLGCAGFDLAVLLQVLHYMDDPDAALRQTYDSLKPGGIVLVGEPKSHLSDADWEATLSGVARAGFTVGECRVMYNLRLAAAKK